MTIHHPYIAGDLESLENRAVVQSFNPATGEKLPDLYPVSSYAELETAVLSAQAAATILLTTPPETIAQFLETFADNIEANG
ncbi:MAG: aldehyde dehydrogenase (NADP(+)), partial [Anaerolineae bacterium]|nr:aldehyde dehydrogenase (NADP(+)) [Anaerolineae bacterium]